LETCGATVHIIVLPQGVEKIGADDFFAKGYSSEDLDKLRRLRLKEPPLGQHKQWYESWIRRIKEKERKQTQKGNEDQVSDEELMELADPVISAPDVLELYREEFRRLGYGGDVKPVLIVELAITTRTLKMRRGAMPAHTGILGPPALGKSYTVQTALLCCPPE